MIRLTVVLNLEELKQTDKKWQNYVLLDSSPDSQV